MNISQGGEQQFANFSRQVKKEICAREHRLVCCQTAAAYGIACFSKYFDTKGLVLNTEQEAIALWALDTFAACGIKGQISPKNGVGGTAFEFSVKQPFEVDKMLAMFGHTGDEVALRILQDNFLCGACVSAFVGAAFVCCGTIPNPRKGYSLEFVLPRYLVLQDLAEMLRGQGLSPKLTTRGGVQVLYFKSSEQIEDMLTFMGAPKASLELMGLKVYKDLRNRANRATNCETANIDKMVAANQEVLGAIMLLEKKGLLQTLPPPLLEAALLRREHPEVSLAELARLSPGQVSKSGLSHRYRKIIVLAEHAKTAEKVHAEKTSQHAKNIR